MLTLPDYGKPYLIDSLTSPIAIRYIWSFNAQMCDFMLQQITYLEETTGGAVKLRINNSEFWVPSTWFVLVTDRETYQLDTISVQACSATPHIAYSFSPDEMNLRTLPIQHLESSENMTLVHPMINKGCALVHPVGPTTSRGKQIQLSVVIGPHDLYKHLTNKVVGDLID